MIGYNKEMDHWFEFELAELAEIALIVSMRSTSLSKLIKTKQKMPKP